MPFSLGATVSGYFGNLSEADGIKLSRIVSYIICVQGPLLIMIHSNPGAPEVLFITLF